MKRLVKQREDYVKSNEQFRNKYITWELKNQRMIEELERLDKINQKNETERRMLLIEIVEQNTTIRMLKEETEKLKAKAKELEEKNQQLEEKYQMNNPEYLGTTDIYGF
ncbi:1467_t:CDS:1 [Acaulospora colombiana]|uniref:1467_t:CDS:1 n=1 Tax=Acaulospora colombiana TaxID=27376 RepID=A0ACA9LW89_9GLOM|nr:1467_t:CDS:1 [Acaulospora colombiana]